MRLVRWIDRKVGRIRELNGAGGCGWLGLFVRLSGFGFENEVSSSRREDGSPLEFVVVLRM